MIIDLINIGSELLLGRTLNSHQQWICRQLADTGYEVQRQLTIPDEASVISATVRSALERADLVITTGGLGPTSDDLTRPLLAELFGRELVEDATVRLAIEQFFDRRGRRLPSSVLVQALVPEGAEVLMNRHGTAPGLFLCGGPGQFKPQQATALIMLPGPPRELHPMFVDQVMPLMRTRFPLPEPLLIHTFRTTGMGESFVEEKIGPALQALPEVEVGYCARVGEVDIRLVVRGNKTDVMHRAQCVVREQLSENIYGDEHTSLEAAVIELLRQRRSRLSVAESCTGGFLSHRLTNVPGASDVFWGGALVYDNKAKQLLVDVPETILQEHGAVSEACARAMAEGARKKFATDYALSITGIAGPGGGSDAKPVGTVFIGLAGPEGVEVKKHLNHYDRETFKFLTTQQALELLRRSLVK